MANSAATSWRDLPAYRWNGNMSFHVNQGNSLTGAIKVAMDAIGSFFWAISGFIWSVLLDVVRWATTTDLLARGVTTVNRVASTVGSAVLANGVIPSIILLIAIIVAVVAFTRRGLKGLSHVLISCAFLGAAFGTFAAAATNSVGSPAWFVGIISKDTGYLAGTIGGITPPPAAPGPPAPGPNCTSYDTALTNAFKAANKGAAGGIGSAVSSLWLQSYAIPWATAQFGSTPATERVYCHWLEWTNTTQATTQSQVAGSAHYPPHSGNNVFAKHYNSRYGGIYGPYYWLSTPTQGMFAWAMCEQTGAGWGSPTEFSGLNVSSMGLNNGKKTWGQSASKYCSGWYNNGDGVYGPTFGGHGNNPFNYLTTGSHIANAVGGGSAGANNTAANSFFTTWNGSNPVGVILGGFITMFVAAFFGIVIGALALGTLIAQLIIVLLAGLLPLLFLVLAVPSVRRHGVEMAKAATGLFLAKAVFTVIMTLFILLTVTIDALLMNALPTAANNSLSATLLMVLAPLVAFFVLHRLAKMVGFGHIFSVRGALATTGAFAVGDMMGQRRQARENRYTSNYAQGKTFHQRGLTGPVNRSARSAARAAPGAAVGGGKAVYGGAKKGGAAAGRAAGKGAQAGARAVASVATDGASEVALRAQGFATSLKQRVRNRRGGAGGTAPGTPGGDGAPGGGMAPGGRRGPNAGGPGGTTRRAGAPGAGGGPAGSVNRPLRTRFSAPVVGTTATEHRPAYQRLRGTPNAQLALRREPNNPRDPNAVAVMHGQDRVGYVGRGLAARMAPQMDAGEGFGVSHEFVTHPDYPDNPGLRLHVTPQHAPDAGGGADSTASTPAIPLRTRPPAPQRREPQPPSEPPATGEGTATGRQQARARRRTPPGSERVRVSGEGPRRRVIGDVGRSGQHSPGRAGVRARMRSD